MANKFFSILNELGLSEAESTLYGLLLESGTSQARPLTGKSGLGRGNVYNALMQLRAKGLVIVIEGKKQQFQAVDPSSLRSLLEHKLNQAKNLEAQFNQALPELASAFRLSTGRPAIQIFEGLEGSEKALIDSLTGPGEILTYLDPDALQGPLATINERYVRKRLATGIKKRILMPDTKESRMYAERMRHDLTEIRFVRSLAPHFKTAMELYGDKVSFHTLTPKKIISFIIEDASVAALQRSHFECIWRSVEASPAQAAADTDRSPAIGAASNAIKRTDGSLGSLK